MSNFSWREEVARIVAMLMFWMILGAAISASALWGFVTAASQVPDWFASFLNAVLDLKALALVIGVALFLFWTLRRWRWSRSVARAAAEDISRVLYACGTYAPASGFWLWLAGWTTATDWLHIAIISVVCLPLGFLWARLVHASH